MLLQDANSSVHGINRCMFSMLRSLSKDACLVQGKSLCSGVTQSIFLLFSDIFLPCPEALLVNLREYKEVSWSQF